MLIQLSNNCFSQGAGDKKMKHTASIFKGLEKNLVISFFFVKPSIVNVLGFVRHKVSITTT